MGIGKSILVLLLIIGLMVGGILYLSREDAVYIKVRVNLTQLENRTLPRIDNLTTFLEPVQKTSEPRGTDVFTPGIVVLPFQSSQMIGYWTSVPYKGNGTYDLNVGLTTYPKKGEWILLNIRFLDANGTELTSLTYDTQLK